MRTAARRSTFSSNWEPSTIRLRCEVWLRPADRHVLSVAHDRRYSDRSVAMNGGTFATGDARRRSSAGIRPRATGIRLQQSRAMGGPEQLLARWRRQQLAGDGLPGSEGAGTGAEHRCNPGVPGSTSNYTAEFGRGAGAVVNVSIKSGTNVIHGTVHEFLRHDILDARDAFDYFDSSGDGKADPNALQQHQFGFTLGGPIRKSRTFYFASLEISSVNTTENRLLTVPTLGERDGIFDPTVVVATDPVTSTPFPGTPSRATDGIRFRAAARSLAHPNLEGTPGVPITYPTPQTRGGGGITTCAWTTCSLHGTACSSAAAGWGSAASGSVRFPRPASGMATTTFAR